MTAEQLRLLVPLPAFLAGHAAQEPLPNQPGQIDGLPVTVCAVLTRTAVIEGADGERHLVRLDQVHIDPDRFGLTAINAERRALKAARDRGRRASTKPTFNPGTLPARRRSA
jgi:hypothetical protein